jgi:hypothetical protein
MEKATVSCQRGFALPFFLTGLGAGIGLGVLLAPRSGAAMRRLLGRRVDQGKDWVKETAVSAQDYVREQGQELRDRAKEVAEVIGRS